MADLIFAAQFVTAQVGKTGLTVTVDVDRYTISDGSRTALVTGGAATEGRRGLYSYRLASADLALYQYIATFITTNTTVDQQEIPTLGLVVPDMLTSAAPPSASDNATAAAAAILATPANKLATDATGAAAANVTAWNGTAPNNLDANGYIRTDVMSWDGSTVDEVYPLVRPIDNSDGIEYIDRIYIRDAMKLAPTAGAPDAGSIDAQLAALPTDQDINAILAAGTVNGVAEGVSLATEAINVNTFDVSALQAIADAMGLAPTGAPAAGSLLASVAGIEEDTGVTLPATLAALPAAVDSELSGGHGAGEWGGAGAWPKPFVYTLTNTATGQTIAGALIEVYANIGMTALVDQGVTDAYGRVRFELPSGTYYFKRTKTGWDFTNPDTEVQA